MLLRGHVSRSQSLPLNTLASELLIIVGLYRRPGRPIGTTTTFDRQTWYEVYKINPRCVVYKFGLDYQVIQVSIVLPQLNHSTLHCSHSTTMESVAGLLSWGNLVGVVFVYYLTLGFYRLFLHPLARFPGPKLAAVSRWYEGYYDLIKVGQYTRKIKELHKQYGKKLSPCALVRFIFLNVQQLTSCRPNHPYQPLRAPCQ